MAAGPAKPPLPRDDIPWRIYAVMGLDGTVVESTWFDEDMAIKALDDAHIGGLQGPYLLVEYIVQSVRSPL